MMEKGKETHIQMYIQMVKMFIQISVRVIWKGIFIPGRLLKWYRLYFQSYKINFHFAPNLIKESIISQ